MGTKSDLIIPLILVIRIYNGTFLCEESERRKELTNSFEFLFTGPILKTRGTSRLIETEEAMKITNLLQTRVVENGVRKMSRLETFP